MKNLKLFAFVCAAALAFGSASAQFTTGGKKSSMGFGSQSAGDISDYNIIGLSYVNEHFGFDYDGGGDPDPISMNGFAVKYIHGFSLSSTMPAYIETGLNFSYAFHSETDDNDYLEPRQQHAALAVPVNFAWRFNVADNIYLKPYLGLNLKLNVIGKQQNRLTDTFLDDYREVYDEAYDGDTESDWLSWYDKDDMGSKDAVWNRFQLGWHIGAAAQFSGFYIGLDYGTDFIKAWKYKKSHVNSATFNLTAGVCF